MIATNAASASVIPVIKNGWRVLLLPLYNEDSSIKYENKHKLLFNWFLLDNSSF